MSLAIIFLVFLPITLVKSSLITLYMNESNKFEGLQGYVQYSTGEDVGFISGSSWDYYGADAVCSELGKFYLNSKLAVSAVLRVSRSCIFHDWQYSH